MTFDEILAPLTAAVYATHPAPTVDEDELSNKEIWYVYRRSLVEAMAVAERNATDIFNAQ